MKLKEIKAFVDRQYAIRPNSDKLNVCIEASGYGSQGGTSCAQIKYILKGIDWDHNNIIIHPVDKLQRKIDVTLKTGNRLFDLTLRHIKLMEEKNIIISVYTNASGFLWGIAKVDSGTDLGWSDHHGDCEFSGAFTTYENALEDALNLIDKCDLNQFRKETPDNQFHWGNYSSHLDKNYR